MAEFRVSSAAEVAEVVTWATSEGVSLEIVAGNSKRDLGRKVSTVHVLDVSGLAGVVDYEPSELVLTARAATKIAEIEALVAAAGQMLAFEPPDWRTLLGRAGEPTLGGVLACNLAGPRRVRAGAARDHFLGFSAVDGWGDAWKAGSRVVKNVTGYDMCKLQSGAYGTLSVLTEVSVKVMPRPETECSLVVPVVDDAVAISLLSRALNTPHEVSAAAYLPNGFAGPVCVMRLEGPAPSVAFRAGALEGMLGGGERFGESESRALWAKVSAVAPLIETEGRCVWRLCPTPASAPALLATLRGRFATCDAFCDWGGGLVWVSLAEEDVGADGGAASVREAMREMGGHATLIRAADAVRQTADVFEPMEGALAALSARVKAGFDPKGTLNPGRMQKGI